MRADEPGRVDVEPGKVPERFERLSQIFADMMVTVADVSTRRCPYRDRLDRCTAGFGCRNQVRPAVPGMPRICGGDDRIDYRSAWETK